MSSDQKYTGKGLPPRRRKRKMPLVDVVEDTSQKNEEKETQVTYEYLDHTADIQVHSWGRTLSDALEGQVLGMMNYMTPLDKVDINASQTTTLTAKGHSLLSMIYSLMNECLYHFHASNVIIKEIQIVKMDMDTFTVTARVSGELFDMEKHEQGTEVKAITYSAMRVQEEDDGVTHVWVVVDI